MLPSIYNGAYCEVLILSLSVSQGRSKGYHLRCIEDPAARFNQVCSEEGEENKGH
jgi:hypothetical protein